MILIVTHKQDYTADFVINKLNKKNIKYFRFNCEDINIYNYKFSNSGDFDFSINGHSQFNAVWFRRTKLPELEGLATSRNIYLLEEYDALLSNILKVVRTRKWLSNPKNIYKAENKIYQLKIAKEIGFFIPETLITNDKKEIVSFVKKHNYNAVIKPLHSGRINSDDNISLIYTNKISKNHLNDLEGFDITPCIIQQYIEKEYELRLTVVNKSVFAAKVSSQIEELSKIDWRRKKMLFESYVLPENIQYLCLKLVEKLGLHFGAIDMIKSTDGNYYFLEINPNGQWAWIEMDTKLPISDEIINFLCTV